ncbi:MAG TPA: hypothetical protein VKT52_03430, partial [Ktedonobacterales bacterium]|nr:hypothetical protein [Ktedonobacterales bacterium]
SAAGYFSGRDTLKAGMGAVAGMIAFVTYAILSLIYTPGTVPVTPTPTPKPGTPAVNPAAAASAFIVSQVVILGIAALMGWLGGRPGATNARKRLELTAPKSSTENARA